jgi:transketolase C-terminal domain/subunit
MRTAIKSACKETYGIVTIKEDRMEAVISETCMDQGLKTRIFNRLGLNNEYSLVVGSQSYLRANCKIDFKNIVSRVKFLIDNQKQANEPV